MFVSLVGIPINGHYHVLIAFNGLRCVPLFFKQGVMP